MTLLLKFCACVCVRVRVYADRKVFVCWVLRVAAVSYTHLDVYKRQVPELIEAPGEKFSPGKIC